MNKSQFMDLGRFLVHLEYKTRSVDYRIKLCYVPTLTSLPYLVDEVKRTIYVINAEDIDDIKTCIDDFISSRKGK